MSELDYQKLFDPLWDDLKGYDSYPAKRPLLAHYTSMVVLEAILKHNEVWFSNPLFMNDLEEVRFGINEGASLFMTSPEIESACGSQKRSVMLRAGFRYWYDQFANEHVLDTYVFCLSEHEKEDMDGLLSMWRGYGGNGSGAAIVFDTAKLIPPEESPFILSEVHYGTTEKRRTWLRERITQFVEILAKSNIPDDQLHLCAYYFFQRVKLFAIFSKHRGFGEEHEWRVVYMRDRDRAKVFDKMFGYWMGSRGVEPKLKLKINAVPDLGEIGLNLSTIIDKIILGPSLSSPLARNTIIRMVENLGRADLKDRIISSTIPFRAG
jgi:Protein of unknown function (DUF2971)